MKLYFVLKKLCDEYVRKLIRVLKPPEPLRNALEAGSRTIEYPFLFKNLIKLQNSRILDVGCGGTNLPTELASLGFEVYGIDTRKYLVKHPNVFFIQADMRKSPFKNDCFDIVTAISTVEHIGTREYGNISKDAKGDRKGMKEIARTLKAEGVLLLTAPYGKSAPTRKTLFRIYNARSLNQLIEGFTVEDIEYYAKTGKFWVPVSREKAEGIINTSARSAVLIMARKSK